MFSFLFSGSYARTGEAPAGTVSLCDGVKGIVKNIHTKFLTDTSSKTYSLNGEFSYGLFNKTNPRIENFQCCRTRNVSTKRYICIYSNLRFGGKDAAMKKLAEFSADIQKCTQQYPLKGKVDNIDEVTFYLPDDNIEVSMQCLPVDGVYQIQILVADGNP